MKIHQASRLAQTGVGLIEILIGMVIGLIGMLAMFSVLSIAEEQKRSVAGGSDAQAAAAVGLFALERDVAQAGNGFGNAFRFYGCDLDVQRSAGTRTTGGQSFTVPFQPISITTDAQGHDTITVFYGNSSQMTGQIPYSNGSLSTKQPEQGVTGFTARAGATPGDVLLVTDADDSNCGAQDPTLVQVTNVTLPLVTHSNVTPRGYANLPTPPGGFLYNLGPAPAMNTWTVGTVNGMTGLLRGDFLNNGGPGSIVAENVVDIQAQYGVNTNTLNLAPVIDWRHPEEPLNADERKRIVAIRVAILVRSAHWERDDTDSNDTNHRDLMPMTIPVWSDGTFSVPTVLADGTASNRYRYKVYESVMPLRNAVWGSYED